MDQDACLPNHFNRPICFVQPERVTPPPSWLGHIPFAFWAIDALHPSIMVELGTHTGNSYSAFLQAIKIVSAASSCFAVDTWKGDFQAGFYGEEIFAEFSDYHASRYSAFSTLLRTTFDEAVQHFADHSIDLLHIDGYHTYDAAAHDFRTWLPKMSKRGVVLLHDINVRDRDFGVWRLWDEVASQYPSFSFLHSHGLGVLAVGSEVPEPVRYLTSGAPREPRCVGAIREFFSRLGLAISIGHDVLQKRGEVFQLTAEIARRDAEMIQLCAQVARQDGETARLTADLAGRGDDTARLSAELTRRDSEIAQLAADVGRRDEELNRLSGDGVRLNEEVVRLTGNLMSRAKELSHLSNQAVQQREEIATLRKRTVEIGRLQSALAAQAHDNDRLRVENSALMASTSWRVTAPLRGVKRFSGLMDQRARRVLSVIRRPPLPAGPPVLARPRPDIYPSGQAAEPMAQRLTTPVAAAPATMSPMRAVSPSSLPSISAVLPTYNRGRLLEETLGSCVAHTGGIDVEFIVIDDGSSDDTPAILARLTNDMPSLAWRSIPNGGPGQARNLGASLASNPIVLFLGDDIQPVNDEFFAVHARRHAETNSDRFAVLGQVIWPEPPTMDVNFVMAHIQGRGGEQFGYADLTPHTYVGWQHFYTSNISIRKSVVQNWQLEGFNSKFTLAAFEDSELAYRLFQQPQSFSIYYDPAAVGQHLHHFTVDSFMNRQVACGMMAKVFADLHSEITRPLGLEPLVEALASHRRPNDSRSISDYLTLLEGMKSWARLVDDSGAMGNESWHDDLLFAVFDASYLQGFLLAAADSSSNLECGYQYIMARCLQRLQKILNADVMPGSFGLGGMLMSADH